MKHSQDIKSGSELLLENLDILTKEIFNLNTRITQIEKALRDLRLDTDGHQFEIQSIQTACEQLSDELLKLEREYYETPQQGTL